MVNNMKHITILIPAYNEKEVLPSLKTELDKVTNDLPEYHFDYLFVNDGSSDNTQTFLQQYSNEDSRVHYLEL